MTDQQLAALLKPCRAPGEIFQKCYRSVLKYGNDLNGDARDSLRLSVMLTVNNWGEPHPFRSRPYWCCQVRYHYRNTGTMHCSVWPEAAFEYAAKIAGQFLDGVGITDETRTGRAMDCFYAWRPLTDKEIADMPGKPLIIAAR